jgi:aspartate/methionine/tyrosine aminotransferase
MECSNFYSNLFKVAQDPSFLNLAVGQPNFKPSRKVLNALKENIETHTGYTLPEGLPELRDLIKKKLVHENKIKVEKVIVTNGAIEAIFDSILTHLKPGSEIVLFSPYYGKYASAPSIVGAQIKTIPLNNGRPDIEALKHVITKKTRMIVVNSPWNPTGIVYSKDEIKQLIEEVEKSGLVLLSDEVYEKYIYDDKEHISPGRYSDRVITINSFSKTYGFPGLRLGYLAGSSELIDPILNTHMSNTTCSSYMSQKAAIEALKHHHLPFELSFFDKRRRKAMKILNESELRYIYPEGAFYFYIYVDSDKIFNQLLDKKLLVMPSRVFGDSCNAIRVSYAVDDETLEKGLEILTETL